MRDAAPSRSHSPQPKPAGKGKARTAEAPVPLLPENTSKPTKPTNPKTSPIPEETPRATPVHTPAPDASSDSPVDRLVGVLSEIAGELDVNKAPQSKVNSAIFFKCKIRHYSAAKDVVSFYAKELLPRVPPEWQGTPWHNWLAAVAQLPWTPAEGTRPEDIPAQTMRRAKLAPKTVPANRPATQLPPSIGPRARAARAASKESDSESDGDVTATSVGSRIHPRRSGKAAGLRLASASRKRPASDLDEPVTGGRRGRKAAKGVAHASDDEDEQMEDDAEEASDDEEADAGGEDAVFGTRPPPPPPDGTVRVVVRAERLPTMSPTGPDGTWTCAEEDCGFVVRSADEKDAQELIQEHFRAHEAQAEKINLAVKESRGHMPIKYAYFPPVLLLVCFDDPCPAKTLRRRRTRGAVAESSWQSTTATMAA